MEKYVLLFCTLDRIELSEFGFYVTGETIGP